MKNFNFFKRTMLLVTALLMANGVFAQTNFNAWEFKTGNTGIACGNLEFKTNSISVEFWVNVNDAALQKNSYIFESWHDPNGIRALITETSGVWNLMIFAKDKSSAAKSFNIPIEHVHNKWTHIAFVMSEEDEKAYIYLNGELFSETNSSGGYYGNYRSDGTSTRRFALGAAFWGTPVYLGKLADLRVWSVARSAEEIKANYNKNLIGTSVENPGLYLNYRFGGFERGFKNDANPEITTNMAWCGPEAGWNNYYARETLSALPQNLAIANETLSWTTTNGEFEVSIFNKSDDSEVFTDTIAANSIVLNTLDELVAGTVYYAKVRTLNNGVWSGEVISDDFVFTPTSLNETVQDVAFSVVDGVLIVKAEKAQILNIYTVAGQLVHSVNLVEGENAIDGLAKGFYLANNQKIIIR